MLLEKLNKVFGKISFDNNVIKVRCNDKNYIKAVFKEAYDYVLDDSDIHSYEDGSYITGVAIVRL